MPQTMLSRKKRCHHTVNLWALLLQEPENFQGDPCNPYSQATDMNKADKASCCTCLDHSTIRDEFPQNDILVKFPMSIVCLALEG